MRAQVIVSGFALTLALAGCGKSGTAVTTQTGGAPGNGGASGTGGTTGSGGTTGTGGTPGSGGTTGIGGTVATGGTRGGGGQTGAGGTTGTAMGGTRGPGGTSGRGGNTGTATGGATGGGGSSGIDGGAAVNCAATMPTGGNTYTGANVNGAINGLNYGIWTNGSGGTITVFPNVRAFSATWNNSQDFLAHLGLDWNAGKAYTAYGTITAQFVEVKSGTAGSWSSIGIYGWMHSPCIEWYINEDSWSGRLQTGGTQVTIGGDIYYLTTNTTTGTGGANACEAGHTGSWTQIASSRKTPRQCGTVPVSDHFAAWEAQGWTLGTLASVHINVEVGGGSGTIDFPVADVTTTIK